MAAPSQLRLPLQAAPAFRRDDVLEGASNAEALGRLDRWRDWPGCALALVGPAGVGKSHLAQAWAAETDAVQLAPDTPSARFPATGVAVLVDPADAGADDATLFHLLNRALHGEGALLLVGRRPPAEWPVALPDLRSRLNALAVAQIAEPDEPLLEALLVKLFRERQARPSPELLRYLLRRMDRSAAGAREIVARLDAASEDGRIGLTLARQVLGDEQSDLFGAHEGAGVEARPRLEET